MEEQIENSVPYKDIKNPQKQVYEDSSDENDMDLGLPIRQNIYSYLVLRDNHTINYFCDIIEKTNNPDCSVYPLLTVFEEIRCIIHFARHPHDSFRSKIKHLANSLKREQVLLKKKIQDESYFKRFSLSNVESLKQDLNQNKNMTLLSTIKWIPNIHYPRDQAKMTLEIHPIEVNTQESISQPLRSQRDTEDSIFFGGVNDFQQRENVEISQQSQIISKPDSTPDNLVETDSSPKQNPLHTLLSEPLVPPCLKENISREQMLLRKILGGKSVIEDMMKTIANRQLQTFPEFIHS